MPLFQAVIGVAMVGGRLLLLLDEGGALACWVEDSINWQVLPIALM